MLFWVTKIENLIKNVPLHGAFSSSPENDTGRREAEHEHLLFCCVLKWLFSRKAMGTLRGLREDWDFSDLFCDKLWLAKLIYFIQILETSVN